MAALIETKDMPLRKVVGRFTDPQNGWWRERYECGHDDYERRSGLGYTQKAARRRCWQCAHGYPVAQQRIVD